MKRYYISRGLLSAVVGLLVYFVSNTIWIGILSAVLVFAVFLFLSRSGRYKVKPELGAAAMQRDEWTQGIADKAGRNAWVVVAVTGSFWVLYYSLISPGDVPISVLGSLIFSGMIVYFGSDFWLRRM